MEICNRINGNFICSNYLRAMIYPIARNLLFKFSPEKAHHISMSALQTICGVAPLKSILKSQFAYNQNDLQQKLWGLDFRNPIGLAAGFDKNALYLRELEALGFGYMEIGTVTPKAQPGNPAPRLFRLPQDKALINRMGFNNEGVQAANNRVAKWKDAGNNSMIIGGNIGKNKITPNEEAYKDYEICFNVLFDNVDYFVVNVSSPNTPGLRELQEKSALSKIMLDLQNINQGKKNPRPLFLKIAPDLTESQLDDIIEIAQTANLSGLVATNTTIDRSNLVTDINEVNAIGAGGLSGKPVQNKSTEILDYLYKHLPKDISILASGGIFTGQDAKEKLDKGAKLVQIWTGFIYEGPAIVKKICTYLSQNK
jgi:dihydroorotate dehydrogenase